VSKELCLLFGLLPLFSRLGGGPGAFGFRFLLGCVALGLGLVLLGLAFVFNPAPMPPEIANRVAAVAVFKNPSARYVGPATAVSPLYGRKAIDLCNSGYRVCSRGGGMSPPQRDEMFSGPHVQYLQSGMPSQAAAFAASHLG